MYHDRQFVHDLSIKKIKKRNKTLQNWLPPIFIWIPDDVTLENNLTYIGEHEDSTFIITPDEKDLLPGSMLQLGVLWFTVRLKHTGRHVSFKQILHSESLMVVWSQGICPGVFIGVVNVGYDSVKYCSSSVEYGTVIVGCSVEYCIVVCVCSVEYCWVVGRCSSVVESSVEYRVVAGCCSVKYGLVVEGCSVEYCVVVRKYSVEYCIVVCGCSVEYC